ncbi:Uncharacterised protein [Edwardsiella tarda]|uniref:Uncharacterized protein n=1 Tax=Edwardsiella tarda ATCC 15947 = NBRC 105688 TaxID=667121 RepID=A0AC61TEY0_EDWTA|nr:hypothetical protein [Edwardsiella tarda]UAL57701.1 hypothetical protein K8O98_07265 [Edwardsiella tarda]UCP99240.1 hypothetical protein DCL27_11255 [Edwardsiella tarda ATCC 15947 = NBRC 105688]STD30016.1 Uncharacterised protein [Edwardsiella tarda]
MILTLHDLRHGCASRWLYRWLRHHFPRGGHYGAIYRALIQAERLDWASALAEYGWARGYTRLAFIREDIGAMMHLAERLSSLRNAAAPLPPQGDYAPKIASARDGERWHNGVYGSRIACAGDHFQLGNHAQQSQLACCGSHCHLGWRGDHGELALAGYGAQIACSGARVRLASCGYQAHIASNGKQVRIALSGNAAYVSSAGAHARIVNGGTRAHLAACGPESHLANTGDLARLVSFGDTAKIINSGDGVDITAVGASSVIASVAPVNSIVLGVGGCAALAYHDGKRIRFALAVEGEEGIRAGVRYRLDHTHRFIAC